MKRYFPRPNDLVILLPQFIVGLVYRGIRRVPTLYCWLALPQKIRENSEE